MNLTPVSRCARQRGLLAGVLILLVGVPALAAPYRALPAGTLPQDARLGPLKDLNGYFPFQPPASKEAWEDRAERVRRQILVTLGLWPMPPKTELNAVVHGRMELDGYAVEKVFFESVPGFFVTGSLYRPVGQAGPFPAVLCPHGHWSNGRFTDAGEEEARKQIAQGAERFISGARSPLQARCVQLARMGCVVFHYDMIGYADSVQITQDLAHGFRQQRPEMIGTDQWGLFSPQAESHYQSVMGLQTWNSIRSLDFLLSLPEVDPARVAVTGASGGGTQSFILGAIEDRLAGSFPAVMVSTAMQGGCTCENASGLRVHTGNVEFAALAAPKPQGLTCANDWTVEMAAKGFPELQALYGLLGARDRVELNRGEHFGHNYNHVSRTAMYGFMNRLFKLGLSEPVLERDFRRLSRAELTVWDAAHPAPEGGPEFERKLLRRLAQNAHCHGTHASLGDEPRFRQTCGKALEIVIGRTLAETGDVVWDETTEVSTDAWKLRVGLVKNTTHGEELPAVWLAPVTDTIRGTAIWVDGDGKAGALARDARTPRPEVAKLLAAGYRVLSADLLEQGEFRPDGRALEKARRVENPREAAAYTLGYNHSLFAQRTHDVLTLIQLAQAAGGEILLIGIEGGGRWAGAALAVADGSVTAAGIDTGGFLFRNVDDIRSPDLLPGGAKYLDLPGMIAAGLPSRLALAGTQPHLPQPINAVRTWTEPRPKVRTIETEQADVVAEMVQWLLDSTPLRE
jgi:dienelactone hydrolase